MEILKGFLERFQHLQPVEPVVQSVVSNACTHVLSYTPDKESLTYQHGVVFVHTSAALKIAIQENKILLLEEVKKNLPPHIVVKDIR